MILFSLFSLINSQIFSFHNQGSYTASLRSDDSIFIDLNEGKNTAFIYWRNPIDFPLSTTTCNATKCQQMKDITDNGIQFYGYNTTIDFLSGIDVFIWVIPKELCTGKSVVYATYHVITDTFLLNEKLESLCMFFANDDSTMTLKIATNDKNDLSSLNSYSGSTNIKADGHCEGNSCSHTFTNPFFIELHNVSQTSTINLDFDIKHRLQGESVCSRSIFRIIKDDLSTINNLYTASSDTTCENRISVHDISTIIELMFVVLVMVVIILLLNRYVMKRCRRGIPYHDVDANGPQPMHSLNQMRNDDMNTMLVNDPIEIVAESDDDENKKDDKQNVNL